MVLECPRFDQNWFWNSFEAVLNLQKQADTQTDRKRETETYRQRMQS